jgi:hypothetical protein
MQKAQLVKNVGYRMRLLPKACIIDQYGIELPQTDDDWLVLSANENGLIISNLHTSHQHTLGYDQIHHFTSDTSRREGETKFGFLVLMIQLYLQGNVVKMQPTFKPGEAVPWPKPKTVEKNVDIAYPADAGLQRDLQAQGYRVIWVLESRLARLVDLEGWERVTTQERDGTLVQYRLKDRHEDQVLICKRVVQSSHARTCG